MGSQMTMEQFLTIGFLFATCLIIYGLFVADSDIHRGRLIIVVVGFVIIFGVLLHIFSPDFRQSFNSIFNDWLSTVPTFDLVLAILLLFGFGTWVYKTVKNP